MSEAPLIEGMPAEEYLEGVEDNGSTLLIVGSHPCAPCDVDSLYTYHNLGCVDKFEMMAVNKGCTEWDSYDYIATLESANAGVIPQFPLADPTATVIGLRCGCDSKYVNHTIAMSPAGGTSSLFACVAGLWLGYRRIFLTGVRLEKGSIYYGGHIMRNWNTWKPVLQPYVTIIGDSWLKRMYEDKL